MSDWKRKQRNPIVGIRLRGVFNGEIYFTNIVNWFLPKAKKFNVESIVVSTETTQTVELWQEKYKLWDVSYTSLKINSKWITDLNIKYKIIGFLEMVIGENLCNLELCDEF